jgi:hypothetical protein
VDAIKTLIASGGVIALVVSILVAIIVAAMPFLVWSIHSEVSGLRRRLEDMEYSLEQCQHATQIAALMLEGAAWTLPESIHSQIAALRRLRAQSAQLRLYQLGERKTVIGWLLTRGQKKAPPEMPAT